MAAEYDFMQKPNLNEEDETLLYPRLVIKRTIKTDEFAEKVASRTTFTPGEVRGVLGLLTETLIEYIGEGYTVELDELGYFTASLTSRLVKDKKEIRSGSITMNDVNFRASIALKRKLKGFPLYRVMNGLGFRKSVQEYTIEERKDLLNNFLNENGLITRKEYTQLTGLLKNLALKDLNGWVKEGYLRAKGVRSTKIFFKREKGTEMPVDNQEFKPSDKDIKEYENE